MKNETQGVTDVPDVADQMSREKRNKKSKFLATVFFTDFKPKPRKANCL
jgi:hypothetical protein